jgi:hypothetical protein
VATTAGNDLGQQMGRDEAGTYRYRASSNDEVVSRAGKLLLDWVGPGIPVPVPAMHHLIRAAVIIANTTSTLPDGVADADWTDPLLTMSNAPSDNDSGWLKSSSFQPGSLAPNGIGYDPLPASNFP